MTKSLKNSSFEYSSPSGSSGGMVSRLKICVKRSPFITLKNLWSCNRELSRALKAFQHLKSGFKSF